MSAPVVVPLLEIRGGTRIIGGAVPTTLIEDIDFKVMAGEFVSVTGPSGSGKSSLLYLLGLLDLPTRGEVFVRGRATSRLGEEERAALRLATLGFVFQFHFLLPEFSLLDNVMLPMRALNRLAEREMRSRALMLLDRLGLAGHVEKTHRCRHSRSRTRRKGGSPRACRGRAHRARPTSCSLMISVQ
jgi:lipoprotein-releasing system ATP-binding protein